VEKKKQFQDNHPNGSIAPPQLRLDSTNLTVCLGTRQSSSLTSTEFKIIALLYKSQSHQCHRDELKRRIWEDVKVSSKALDVHMTNLRKKIAPLNLLILQLHSGFFTLQGVGNGTVATPLEMAE
jgi:DNA-binding response OmpR family regulator